MTAPGAAFTTAVISFDTSPAGSGCTTVDREHEVVEDGVLDRQRKAYMKFTHLGVRVAERERPLERDGVGGIPQQPLAPMLQVEVHGGACRFEGCGHRPKHRLAHLLVEGHGPPGPWFPRRRSRRPDAESRHWGRSGGGARPTGAALRARDGRRTLRCERRATTRARSRRLKSPERSERWRPADEKSRSPPCGDPRRRAGDRPISATRMAPAWVEVFSAG